MSLLRNIHAQPPHVRKMMFGLCVVTALSLAGMVWFNSFQHDLYALMNPAPADDVPQRHLAGEQSASPFVLIGQAWGSLKADIAGLFPGDGGQASDETPSQAKRPRGELLPTSSDK